VLFLPGGREEEPPQAGACEIQVFGNDFFGFMAKTVWEVSGKYKRVMDIKRIFIWKNMSII